MDFRLSLGCILFLDLEIVQRSETNAFSEAREGLVSTASLPNESLPVALRGIGGPLHVVNTSSVSSTLLPLFHLNPIYSAVYQSTMSFETTATIASFGGKLLKLAHKATSTNCEMKLNLYLPPQAASESSKKVPVLFYLAGLTCTGDNGAEKGFFQHRASQKGIAIVYPDTSPSEFGRNHGYRDRV